MRAALVVAVGAVAALAVPAGAAVGPREARSEYTSAGGVSGVISGVTYVNGDVYGAVRLSTLTTERSIGVTITDAAASPATAVAAELAQDLDRDGQYETTLGSACGATREPLRLARPGAPVMVFLLAGACDGGKASLPTKGLVTAKLYTRR
jgi:hypothetical protein